MSMILFFKQKTAYEMRISYLSSDVCSSDLKRVAQSTGLDDPDAEMPCAQLAFAEHQRAVDPAPLDGLFDVGREIGDGGRAARQALQRVGHVPGEARRVHREVPDDAMQVGILELQDLVQPMDQLDIRIAAHLAEHGRTLDRPIAQAVELAEHGDPTDLSHSSHSPSKLHSHPGRATCRSRGNS